jgi:hypothetical protein
MTLITCCTSCIHNTHKRHTYTQFVALCLALSWQHAVLSSSTAFSGAVVGMRSNHYWYLVTAASVTAAPMCRSVYVTAVLHATSDDGVS